MADVGVWMRVEGDGCAMLLPQRRWRLKWGPLMAGSRPARPPGREFTRAHVPHTRPPALFFSAQPPQKREEANSIFSQMATEWKTGKRKCAPHQENHLDSIVRGFFFLDRFLSLTTVFRPEIDRMTQRKSIAKSRSTLLSRVKKKKHFSFYGGSLNRTFCCRHRRLFFHARMEANNPDILVPPFHDVRLCSNGTMQGRAAPVAGI